MKTLPADFRLSPPDHPAPETLDEYVDEPGADAGVAAHVASCPSCSGAVADVQRVRDTLRSLPPVAMPDDVCARVSRAVSEVAPAPVSLDPRRGPRGRRRNPVGMTPYLAAAAVVLLVAGVVAGALRVNAGNGDHASTQAAKAPTPLGFTTSGRDYSPTNLANNVPSLLGTAAQRAAGAGNGAAAGGSASSALSEPNPRAATATRTPDLASLTLLRSNPAVLDACVEELTQQPTTQLRPLAIDFGSFQGKAAVVVVAPRPRLPHAVDVYIAGAGCGRVTGGDLLYFQRINDAR